MAQEPDRDSHPPTSSPDPAPQMNHPLRGPLLLFTVVLGFTLIYFMQELLRPIFLAVLLNFLLRGPVGWLEKLKIPRSVGAAVALAAIGCLLVVGLAQLTEPANRWMQRLPRTANQLERDLRELRKPVEDMGRAAEQVQDMVDMDQGSKDQTVKVREESAGQTVFRRLRLLASNLLLVLFILYLLLVFGDDIVQRSIQQLARPHSRRRAKLIANGIEQDISTYLLTISAINACLGVLVGVVAYGVGLPSPWLWGTMAALLNFVPYVGAAVGVAIIALVAYTSVEPLSRALLAPGLYALLTTLEGMLITPVTVGSRFSLNPLIVFLWLLLWGWMWGITGALIAIPLLTMIKVLADQIPSWRPVGAIMAGSRSKRRDKSKS
ncbi:MAG: AI-2E family transporter [Acidobacteriota bacterium]|nr:AI-2E family transporter [Acidobacteriota bacterium]